MQTYRRSGEGTPHGGSFLGFLPFVVIGLVVSIIIFLIIAGVYTFTPMQPSVLSPLAVVVSLICVFAAGFLAGKMGAAPGWLAGGITGIGYAIVMIIAGWISTVVPLLSLRPLIILFACFVVGAVGGIFGINLKPRKRMKGW